MFGVWEATGAHCEKQRRADYRARATCRRCRGKDGSHAPWRRRGARYRTTGGCSYDPIGSNVPSAPPLKDRAAPRSPHTIRKCLFGRFALHLDVQIAAWIWLTLPRGAPAFDGTQWTSVRMTNCRCYTPRLQARSEPVIFVPRGRPPAPQWACLPR